MNKALLILASALCGFTLHGPAHADDKVELQGTTIIGNRELPKVLYIMPWKRAEPGELVDQPINSVFDEVIAPVDREVLRRELNYFKLLDKPK